jgi:hypothetical protein
MLKTKTELDDLERWIRQNMEQTENEGDKTSVFIDGYIHAMFMVLKQIKKMRNEVKV